jgi:periplasmic copper chaperone A
LKTISTHLAIASLALSFGTALAGDIDVKAPWVRGTVASQQATGAFMEITSKAGATLIGAASPVAGVTEIHEMKMEGSMMKMRAIPRLDLPAGKPVTLGPGGYHIMLMNLKQPVKKGDSVPLILQIEGRDKRMETVEVNAEVRDLTATAPAMQHHNH